jgi:glycine/D-amino acid oxidase-like deaminating enzyme
VKVEIKPNDLGLSGWQGILPIREPLSFLEGDLDFDYTIIGAGFAGLAAALRLRQLDPESSIAIVEAREIGEGPIGRNSGFMIDLPHNLTRSDYASSDIDDRKQIELNRLAINYLAEAKAIFGLPDSSFKKTGKINAAATLKGHKHNQSYARHLEQLNEPFELLSANKMSSISGSDYYCGGLSTPGTVMLQPVEFARGFADHLSRLKNCQIFENSAVVEYSKLHDGWSIKTTMGSIRSEKVILAVNGLVETFGFFKQRLMHINLYGSMTRALSPNEMALLGGSREWGFTPSDPLGSTVRRIIGEDGDRILIRNQCTYEPDLSLPKNRLNSIKKNHTTSFKARFPRLSDIEMEYCWSGRLCLSRNNAWALGELEQGLFAACCQNGLGITRGTIAGIVAAEMASDNESQSMFSEHSLNVKPNQLFPRLFMTLGSRAYLKFGQWRAGREI